MDLKGLLRVLLEHNTSFIIICYALYFLDRRKLVKIPFIRLFISLIFYSLHSIWFGFHFSTEQTPWVFFVCTCIYYTLKYNKKHPYNHILIYIKEYTFTDIHTYTLTHTHIHTHSYVSSNILVFF